MIRDAEISPCGQYRWMLSRVWQTPRPTLTVVMLNPSTADGREDDPTIRRCVSFARENSFGRLLVVNLFAFRATSPADMRAAIDPVGEGNDLILETAFRAAAARGWPVLAAWGANGSFRNRDTAVRLRALAAGCDLVCLGTTKEGQPRHPLYVRADQPFIPFG